MRKRLLSLLLAFVLVLGMLPMSASAEAVSLPVSDGSVDITDATVGQYTINTLSLYVQGTYASLAIDSATQDGNTINVVLAESVDSSAAIQAGFVGSGTGILGHAGNQCTLSEGSGTMSCGLKNTNAGQDLGTATYTINFSKVSSEPEPLPKLNAPSVRASGTTGVPVATQNTVTAMPDPDFSQIGIIMGCATSEMVVEISKTEDFAEVLETKEKLMSVVMGGGEGPIFEFTGLDAGTDYYLRAKVTSVDGYQDSDYSAVVKATTEAAPLPKMTAPSYQSAMTQLTENSITVMFMPDMNQMNALMGSPDAKLVVEISKTENFAQVLKSEEQKITGSNNFTFGDLEAATDYYIRAKVINVTGYEDSDYSAVVKATTVEAPAVEGYTVTMGEDKSMDAGETIQIPVTVGYSAAENETAPTTYKSYELIFQYDTEMLTLVTGSSEDEAQEFTVVDESGTVTLRRYGNEKNVGEAAVTLEFTAKKTGESDVKLTSAKVGTSADAKDQNIPDAAIIDNLTKITVTGYDVDLDEAFTGAGVADPEKDYTFEAKDKNYVYTVDVTVGDETFTITDEDEDGFLNIPKDKITGNMKIDVKSAEGKTFNVTITGDGAAAVTGEDKAQYMTDYVLTAAEGVNLSGYTIKYKIGETEKNMPANCTIPGNEITGDITITVIAPGTDPEDPDRPDNSWKITFEGNGKDDIQTDSYYVTKGQPYTFQINKAEGYTYIVTYTVADGVVELTAAEDGTYTITPASDVTIKVMKWNVEINQYVALNGKTVFLVSVAGEAGIGMQYDGNTMFIKSVKAQGENGEYTGAAADKYVYLVELAEGTLTVEDAARKLSIVENVTCETVGLDYNVNESSNLDINDAQLVYDMYNNVYESIATVGMKKFLRADIGGDRIVNVQDAIAVVTAILTSQA